MLWARRSLLAFLVLALAACGGSGSEHPELVVFAAASLRDVAADLAVEFERRHPSEVIFNFAGSNVLAQQIRAAPGADVFLSADASWIDFLDQAARIVAGTRRDVLANRLVLIGHRDAALKIEEPRDLAGHVTVNGERNDAVRFLALADPEAVPAGRYARAALEAIEVDGGNLWRMLAPKVAPALDVRAALALVESDPEIAGIVYQTDALTSEKVRVLCDLPAVGPPIRYGAAVIDGGQAPELAGRFLDFLLSPRAREIAERHGFGAP